MHIKNLLKRRTESTLVQLIRYILVGGIAAIIDIGSFAIFSKYFGINYQIAVLFSFTLGTLTNFVICNAFVFNRQSLPVWLVCIRHYLSSLGGLFINEAVMIFLVGILHFRYLLIAKVIATASAFISNFLLIKFYAFNSKVKPTNKKNRKKR